jgi:SHS2 domain-containing protein
MRVRIAYIIDDNPVLTKELSLDGVEEDWSYPQMLQVDEGALSYTNLYWAIRADRNERILLANMSLTDNWPVPARLDVDDILMTDADGTVHSPKMVRTQGSDVDGTLRFAGTIHLELSFLLDETTDPRSINVTDDLTYIMDPSTIVDAFYPCRLDVVPNFVYIQETDSERRYRFNVTVNNTSDVGVTLRAAWMKLLDSEGTLHSRHLYWEPSETELEDQSLEPGEGVTGEIEYRLPLDLVPVALDYDDQGRFLEVSIAGVKVVMP